MDTLLDVEVDPKLFIICRLCQEEEGVYQILPSVQEQIKFCFGIIVKQFDGLPQLLCKKCKIVVNKYEITKKKFVEQQETLRAKFKEKIRLNNAGGPAPEKPYNTSLTELHPKSDSETSSTKLHKNNKRNRIESTSSTETTDSNRETNKNTLISKPWKNDYVKLFYCKLCCMRYMCKTSVTRHFNKHHNKIRHRHRKILDVKCTVNLQKIDSKPNFTGLPNAVVLRENMILHDEGYRCYYVVYKKSNNSQKYKQIRQWKYFDSHSSSSDDEFVIKKPNKRLRINSGSFTDGIDDKTDNSSNIFNGSDKGDDKSDDKNIANEKSGPKDIVCIDSSDDDMDINSDSAKVNSKADQSQNTINKDKEVDEKIINEIISVCRKKYETLRKNKLHDNATTQAESQLKHKILSVGRKTINKYTGSYTGLIRYLEHKNLNVKWDEKSTVSKEPKVVRVMIKESSIDNIANDESGWTYLEPGSKVTFNKLSSSKSNILEHPKAMFLEIPQSADTPADDPQQETAQQPNITQQPQATQQPQVVPETQIVQEPQIIVPSPSQYVLQQSQFVVHHQHENRSQILQIPQLVPTSQIVQLPQALSQSPIMNQSQFLQQPLIVSQSQALDQAVLYTNVVDDASTKKLLNPHAVANPKQLPKKTHINDTKPIILNNRSNVSTTDSVLMNLGEQIDESNMLMPVITSTTSLAETKNDDNPDSVSVSNNSEKPFPRIKVKPVSELMKPANMINSGASQPANIWGFNHISTEPAENIYVPNNLVAKIQSQSAPMPNVTFPDLTLLPADEVTEPQEKSGSDCIILDTVDFPNTKTNSPFNYFRQLLLLHDLILIEANSAMTRDYVCLLKFKVQFKQENKNLTLCLSLFCSDNMFCMCVKDGNLINIHMAKMSANWQWEILKVFQGDVTNKILQNAQKSGQNVYNRTKTFLCLLKSINQKTD